MEHATRKKVKEHPAALRQQVLNECAQPGASVAKVAKAHGLNANLAQAGARQAGAARRHCGAGAGVDAGHPHRAAPPR